MEKLTILGILFIFIGIVILIISSFLIVFNGKASANNVDVGFGGFIGPIPFGFFTSKKMFWIWLILIIIIILIIIFRRLIV